MFLKVKNLKPRKTTGVVAGSNGNSKSKQSNSSLVLYGGKPSPLARTLSRSCLHSQKRCSDNLPVTMWFFVLVPTVTDLRNSIVGRVCARNCCELWQPCVDIVLATTQQQTIQQKLAAECQLLCVRQASPPALLAVLLQPKAGGGQIVSVLMIHTGKEHVATKTSRRPSTTTVHPFLTRNGRLRTGKRR